MIAAIGVDEIWLKSPQVRKKMLNMLIKNIEERLNSTVVFKDSRIIVECLNEKCIDILKNTFGVKKVYLGYVVDKKENIVDELKKIMTKEKTYKIRVNRADKSFPFNSIELSKKLSSELEKEGFKLSVKNYDKELIVEIRKEDIFIFTNEYEGVGGLPYGSQNKTLSLFSGGIDSPVASWMVAKRGVEVDFFHFSHCGCFEKEVYEIYDYLKYYWGIKGSFILLDGREIVKNIKEKIPRKYRMAVFKAVLYNVANIIAEEVGAISLTTGESIGQVSTQTHSLLSVLDKFSSRLVMRPLLGLDKEEIKSIARNIGTLYLSEKVKEKCRLAKKVVTKIKFDKLNKMVNKVLPFKEYVLSNIEVVK